MPTLALTVSLIAAFASSLLLRRPFHHLQYCTLSRLGRSNSRLYVIDLAHLCDPILTPSCPSPFAASVLAKRPNDLRLFFPNSTQNSGRVPPFSPPRPLTSSRRSSPPRTSLKAFAKIDSDRGSRQGRSSSSKKMAIPQALMHPSRSGLNLNNRMRRRMGMGLNSRTVGGRVQREFGDGGRFRIAR